MKTINDLTIEKGTRVLLRLDFNVPINETGEIENTFRIDESLATIKLLQDHLAQTIIIAHKEKGSLDIVAKYLETKLTNFKFVKDIKEIGEIINGDVILLENIRLDEREKSKEESERDELGKELSDLGEVFINDAFSASHRDHASITSIPKFLPSCLGPNFVREVTELTKALNPTHPTFLIIGGAKFETKLAMLEKFLPIVENIFVGGALAHSFWKAKNYELGKSLLDEEVKLKSEVISSPKIILPMDVMVESREIKNPDQITSSERIVDFGDKTLQNIENIVNSANTIIWNGPLGYYEGGYDTGTKDLLKFLGKLDNKIVILGGGDTVAVVEKLLKEAPELKYTHVSSAGGAMIDFLSHGTLPGIEAIK